MTIDVHTSGQTHKTSFLLILFLSTHFYSTYFYTFIAWFLFINSLIYLFIIVFAEVLDKMCLPVQIYIKIYVWMSFCHKNIFILDHIHMCVYMYIYVQIFIYMQINVWLYIHSNLLNHFFLYLNLFQSPWSHHTACPTF